MNLSPTLPYNVSLLPIKFLSSYWEKKKHKIFFPFSSPRLFFACNPSSFVLPLCNMNNFELRPSITSWSLHHASSLTSFFSSFLPLLIIFFKEKEIEEREREREGGREN